MHTHFPNIEIDLFKGGPRPEPVEVPKLTFGEQFEKIAKVICNCVIKYRPCPFQNA
jgi:hypothetical protein